MDDSNKTIDEKINEKFEVIDKKLKNSFKAVKQDIQEIKTKIPAEIILEEIKKLKDEIASKESIRSIENRIQKLENRSQTTEEKTGLNLSGSLRELLKKKEKIPIEETKAEFAISNPYPTLVRAMIVILPIILILSILYANFAVTREYNSFYDIGSEADAKNPYFFPEDRISDILRDPDTYRSLISSLVYTNVKIPLGSDNMNIAVRFRDNFPEGTSFLIGAKDKNTQNYLFKTIYSPLLEEISSLDSAGKETGIYRINKNLPVINSILEIPENSVIASTININPPLDNEEYAIKDLTISTGLKGEHTFYIYLKDSLNIKVKKQDLNQYDGADKLIISLFDTKDNLIESTSIEDDGIITVNNAVSKIQEGSLNINNLRKGIYKLEFSDFDGLIREISLNTDKIVANKLFLADSNYYIPGIQKPSEIFFKANKKSQLDFRTYHDSSFQNLVINGDSFGINDRYNSLAYPLEHGEYTIRTEKNDIVINAPGYLSFSKESYFEPFKYSLVEFPSSLNQLEETIDYVITDYSPVKKEENWFTGLVDLTLNDLYIKDGNLSILFNAPHLSKEGTQSYLIPVDWINITMTNKGIFR